MKYVSLAIAVVAVFAALRFLTLAPSIDPCNPPVPRVEALAAASIPGGPAPTLAPAPALAPQYDAPANVLFVTVEAELRPDTLDTEN